MKERTAEILAFLMVYGGLLIIIISVICFYRGIQINRNLSMDEVCKLELGEDWKYEYTKDFGATCVQLDYVTLEKINRQKYDMEKFEQLSMIDKHCYDKPKFFDFNRWDNGCDIEDSKYNKVQDSEGERT